MIAVHMCYCNERLNIYKKNFSQNNMLCFFQTNVPSYDRWTC